MFDEQMRVKAGGEELAVFIARAMPATPLNFLFLHGAGKSESMRTHYLACRLQGQGVSSVSLDFSGHGKSSGDLLLSSLQKRVGEALAVFPLLAEAPLTLCGSSMGGYVALRLLQETPLEISRIILFCPAIYDQRAYAVPFGDGFSEIIRGPESWRDTDVLSPLERFTGELYIVIGEEDEVIPEGVIHLLDKHSPRVRRKKIIRLPDCPHKIHFWLAERPHLVGEILMDLLGG